MSSYKRHTTTHESPRIRVVNLPRVSRDDYVPDEEKASIVPGVLWMKGKGKWAVHLSINGKATHLGHFWEKQKAEQVALEYRHRYPTVPSGRISQQTNSFIGKSKYIGVYWHIRQNKWVAHTKYKRCSISLGSYADEKKAALAYDKKAIELYGSDARTNQMMYPADFAPRSKTSI